MFWAYVKITPKGTFFFTASLHIEKDTGACSASCCMVCCWNCQHKCGMMT